MISLPDIILPKHEFFGLSIDQRAIRGIQLDSRGMIIHSGEILFPEEVFSHNILVKPQLFQQAIQVLNSQGKFTTPYVVVTFPEAFAYTREIRLPILPLDDLSEAVQWHSVELFPFPQEDIYFDWKILRKTDQQYVLCVVAVLKKTIDPIVNILLSEGLKPLNLGPDASTLTHLLKLPSDRHAILAEVNRDVSYVTLVEGEKSVFTTVVAFTDDDTKESYLHAIVRTIHEVVSYYQTKNVITEKVLEILLTGELAQEQLLSNIEFPVKLFKTPANNPSFNKAYAVAAMEVNTIPAAEIINLLPPSMQKKYFEERKMEYYNALLFRGISLAASYCVFVLFVLLIVLFQKQEVNQEVKRLTTIRETSQKSSQNLLKVNATAKQIIALAPFRKMPHEKFDMFFSIIPDGILLTQIDYDDSKLLFRISGTAKTRDNLLDLKSSIEQSNQFGKVSLPLSLLEISKDINFSIEFTGKQ
ncbi:MAG: hypothetical protein N3A54_05240 [Patescibacteria group bacterium]|nr:hypothetical protein [Patescibacteria group bacterium]